MDSLSRNASSPPVVVFFDGGCRLCRTEIGHYQRLDRENRLQWVDISRDPTLLNTLGVTYEKAMQRLHVLDDNGVLRDGVRGFIVMWSALPYYRVLANLIRVTRATALLEPLYRRFAAWRYARRATRGACPARAQS